MNTVTQPTGPQASGTDSRTPIDGRSARWRAHREERRSEILDVARRLIHKEGPDVTMDSIAAASGTSKSIIYRYFEDKSTLQRAIGMHILSGMHRRMTAEAEQSAGDGAAQDPMDVAERRIRAMIAAYVEATQQSPNVYRFITRPSEDLNHFLATSARMVATALPPQIDSGYAQIWASGAVGFVQGAVDRWMRDGSADRPGSESLIDHLVLWLREGILTALQDARNDPTATGGTDAAQPPAPDKEPS